MEERYYSELLFAAVRGYAERIGKGICELSSEDEEEIARFARENEFKTYHFKKKDILPRVHKVIGFLRSIYFENLLDVGSGRGVFLFPFLENFPYVEVTSVDILDKRVELLTDIKNGGIDRLNVVKADICTQPEITGKEDDEHQKKSVYLTENVTFGRDEVIFVDENRGIRKTIIDKGGLIHCFPGIIMEEFWMKEVETLKNLSPKVKYRTSFSFKADKWLMLWEIQPDGRYWGDDDGFGMEDDLEIVLYTYLDINGNFTGPFRLYSLNMKKYFTEENK